MQALRYTKDGVLIPGTWVEDGANLSPYGEDPIWSLLSLRNERLAANGSFTYSLRSVEPLKH